MGKGGNANSNSTLKQFTWNEFQECCSKDEKWIVIDNCIYNVSNWMKKHPGGAKIIAHFVGQDATEAWTAMHEDKNFVGKYMKPLIVGQIQSEQSEIVKDMAELRQVAEKNGWFKVNPWFYVAHLSHILLLEALAVMVLYYFGTGWMPYITAALILTTSQAQAGWSQHDYGHLSVFKSSLLNHAAHQFVIGSLKAASSHWWNFRHFQHHAKPNVIKKDPDVSVPKLFTLGDVMPKIWGERKMKGWMPFNWQQHYFWLFGPAALLPVYFHLEVIYFVFKRRKIVDFLTIMSFFVRFSFTYAIFIGMGHWNAFCLYMFVRFLESIWFTMVTQMNHIPMKVDKDHGTDWLTSQTLATCNVDPSFFNDWFTGHLNFQIEHHLFPTMPRHNYIKVKPLVESLCKKHNLPYISKPLMTAFADIIRSLRKSGEIWYDAYYG